MNAVFEKIGLMANHVQEIKREYAAIISNYEIYSLKVCWEYHMMYGEKLSNLLYGFIELPTHLAERLGVANDQIYYDYTEHYGSESVDAKTFIDRMKCLYKCSEETCDEIKKYILSRNIYTIIVE